MAFTELIQDWWHVGAGVMMAAVGYGELRSKVTRNTKDIAQHSRDDRESHARMAKDLTDIKIMVAEIRGEMKKANGSPN